MYITVYSVRQLLAISNATAVELDRIGEKVGKHADVTVQKANKMRN